MKLSHMAALLSGASAAVAQQIQSYSNAAGISLQYYQVQNGPSHDLRVRLQAPAAAGWGAVGIGEGMIGSLMFLIYPSADSTKATVSLRSANSHVMPQPITGVEYSVVNSTIQGGTMSADVICKACAKWQTGEVNVNGNSQSFIWAHGPGERVASDDNAASVEFHANNYGFFALNPSAANFAAGTPESPFLPSTATVSTQPAMDSSAAAAAEARRDYIFGLVHAHAVLMGLAWGVFAPVALLLVRGVSVRFHYLLQTLVIAQTIAGLGIGLYFSTLINKWGTIHQGIGFFVVAGSIVQGLVGAFSHLWFKRSKRSHDAAAANGSIKGDASDSVSSGSGHREKTAHAVPPKAIEANQPATPFRKTGLLLHISTAHMWFGRLVVLFGAVNMPLGFALVGWKTHAIGTGVAVAVVSVSCVSIAAYLGWSQRRKQALA